MMYKGDGVMDFSTLTEPQFNEVVGQLRTYTTLLNTPVYGTHNAVLLLDEKTMFYNYSSAENLSQNFSVPLFAPQYYSRGFESGYEFMMVHY